MMKRSQISDSAVVTFHGPVTTLAVLKHVSARSIVYDMGEGSGVKFQDVRKALAEQLVVVQGFA
jgi:DNA primase